QEQRMLALSRSGRQAEALDAFQQGRRVLVEELGIDPSPRLQQLHGAILRQESALEPERPTPAQDHFEDVTRSMFSARVVPVLGPHVAQLTRSVLLPSRYSHDGTGTLIDQPNTYAVELSLERRPVILKLHGQIARTATREWESFVVTEDDYIDYLARTEVAGVLPVSLAAALRRSHFLFLGYTMADWTRRVTLHRLWGHQPLR